MKIVKRFVLWLAAMLAVILIADAAGAAVHYSISGRMLRGTANASPEKMSFPLEAPQNEEEERKNSSVLASRTNLDDYSSEISQGMVGNLSYSNYRYDTALIFLNREGRHEFSGGTYARVYRDTGDKNDDAFRCFGLIHINSLAQMPETAVLQEALERDPDCTLRLDAYTIEHNTVTPVSVTLLDASGKEMQTVTFPADGDVIHSDDCYIFNRYSYKEDAVNSASVLEGIQLAKEGIRPADRLAEKYAETLPLGEDSYEKESVRFGICSVAIVCTSIVNGNAMSGVQQVTYTEGVIFYSVILGVIVTVILLTVWLIKDKKEKSKY